MKVASGLISSVERLEGNFHTLYTCGMLLETDNIAPTLARIVVIASDMIV